MTASVLSRRLRKLEAKRTPATEPLTITRIIIAPASGNEDAPSVIYTLVRNPETGRYDWQ